MAAGIVSLRTAMRLPGAAVLLWLTHTSGALAFPLLDPTNDTAVPNGTNLATPDASDLRNQLQLANGLTPPAGGGWTIVPRIDVEEMFNDNVLQANTPRRWDFVTLLSPGISIAGDLPRIQMTLDYSPTLEEYMRTGSEDALAQQLSGTALVTLVPDFAYVNALAFAGVSAANGLLGGVAGAGAGSVGQVNGTAAPTSTTAGLSNQDLTQTTSFQISPYLMRRFGDLGTGKIGVSGTETQYNTASGFAAVPFPTGGGNGTTAQTTEEYAQFTSGDILGQFQDSLNVDLTQSTSRTNQLVDITTGATTAIPSTTATSTRQIVSDQLTYALNDWSSVFASLGHEDIHYSQANTEQIDDMTWSVGTNVAPNPDSEITVSYGHQNGTNSIQANGSYAVTARTTISGSYTNTIGTTLEETQQLVDRTVYINPVTGQFGANGVPLVLPLLQQGSQQSVYRYNTLQLNAQTTWDRDIFTLGIVWSVLSSTNNVSSGDTKTATFQWQHSLQEDLTLNTSVSYTQQTTNGGESCWGALAYECANSSAGTTTSLAAGATLQYTISDTLSAHLRYLFYDRSSAQASYNMYQNLIVVGFTKTF